MKKIFCFVMCCFFSILLYASVGHTRGVYIEPRVALDFSQSDYTKDTTNNKTKLLRDDNVSGGLALGYDFHKILNIPIRIEAEFMIANNMHYDFNGKTVKVPSPQSFFANAYIDYHNSTNFIPYVGGGIGTTVLKSETKFSWNIGTGVAYKFNDNWKAVLGYRHIRYGNYQTKEHSGKLSSNEVLLGIRYTF